MSKAFEKKLWFVRLRCSVNLLIKQAGWVLSVAGLVAVMIILAERLLAITLVNLWTFWGFWGAVIVLVFLPWLLRLPNRMQASLLLDQRLKLHERFSTTLALADSQDPFAGAARAEARQTARHVNLRGHFPIRPSRCWLYMTGTWLTAFALVLFMPQKDLLGLLRKHRQRQEQAKQLQQAQLDIKQATSPVKLAVKQLGDPELDEELGKLDSALDGPKGAKPEDIKRQAIRTLGDISEQIKRQSNTQFDTAEVLQRMFRQLPGSLESFSQQLRQMLAQGRFAEAYKLLSEIQKKLEHGNLTDEQRKALTEQLRKLGKQLQELAEKNKELEKELEKLGLDKRLAKLSNEQLREVLQKQGLSEDMLEKLLQKAAACRSACSNCASLGGAMAACGSGIGGLAGGELDAVMDVLDELDATQQRLEMMRTCLAQINGAIGCLGDGMCQGIGGRWSCGPGGGGGKGIGTGQAASRSIGELGEASTKRTRVRGKPGEGAAVASWYIKGTQVKGEAKREFSEVVQAARDSAAEAINENQIPRKYEDAVKSYFGGLDRAAGEGQ